MDDQTAYYEQCLAERDSEIKSLRVRLQDENHARTLVEEALARYEEIVREVAEGGDLAPNGSRLIRASLRAEAREALVGVGAE